MAKIKVLIVDDSALIRQMFTEILGSDESIEIVGSAREPYEAREKIKELNPDVLTLDIEMPNMDGLSFLQKIMSLRPMPVVMVSSLTQKGATQTIKALEIGAVDYVSKSGSASFDSKNMAEELVRKVKNAARAKVKPPKEDAKKPEALPDGKFKKGMVIAIGSSTGGVEALREVIPRMPKNAPPILVTQHMPALFTKPFAERLNKMSQVTVHEARDRQKVEEGNVYIAPGGRHLQIKGVEGKYFCSLDEGEAVSGHKPSVDVLFSSMAVLGNKAVGAILTGMGKDGAKGMLEMKKAGAVNVGESEKSALIYGMPKAAFLAGAVDKQMSLREIPNEILKLCT